MNNILKGKRILFFSAKAFGIPENIVSTLEKFGAIVDYYDERPANTFFVKAMIRINRNIIATYINKYHNSIIKETIHNKYDYIFFIKGESFSEHNLKKLFSCHPEAKTVIYHWDSIANNKNAINLLDHFDYAYSFDEHDCEKLNMRFLPLFYFDEYKEVARSTLAKDYDMLFVGTTHSDRYRFITTIANQIHSMGGKCYTYFFFQGKLMFYKAKLLTKSLRGVSIHNVHFKPVPKDSLLDLYKRSRIIVDIQHPRQTGLTLRCLESVGAKRKLITTNKEIIHYDFYNESNILVVDRNNPIINKAFVESDYIDIPKHIYEKYSISSWVISIFSSIQ